MFRVVCLYSLCYALYVLQFVSWVECQFQTSMAVEHYIYKGHRVISVRGVWGMWTMCGPRSFFCLGDELKYVVHFCILFSDMMFPSSKCNIWEKTTLLIMKLFPPPHTTYLFITWKFTLLLVDFSSWRFGFTNRSAVKPVRCLRLIFV